MTFP
jgi:hypothetical protein